MKILRYISVIVFFQLVGFLITIPLLFTSLFIGDYFDVLNFLFMVVPTLIAIGISLFLSSRFHTWLKGQPEKKQIYIGVPLATLFTLILVLEAVSEKESNSVFDKTKEILPW